MESDFLVKDFPSCFDSQNIHGAEVRNYFHGSKYLVKTISNVADTKRAWRTHFLTFTSLLVHPKGSVKNGVRNFFVRVQR